MHMDEKLSMNDLSTLMHLLGRLGEGMQRMDSTCSRTRIFTEEKIFDIAKMVNRYAKTHCCRQATSMTAANKNRIKEWNIALFNAF